MENAAELEMLNDIECRPHDTHLSESLPLQAPAPAPSMWNYRTVLEQFLRPAHWIKVTDPFCRNARQMESLLLLAALVEKPSECRMHLITRRDEFGQPDRQLQLLQSIQTKLAAIGMAFTYDIGNCIEERSIATERWEIRLNKGLDLFRMKNGSLQTRSDPIEIRPCY